MKRKRILSVLIILSVVVMGAVSVWPEEEGPFHAWPGLVDITLMDLDSAPRYGRDDPASIMSGAASYWGRAVDQDGNPMKGATLSAQLGVHFGHGKGPKTWRKQIILGDDGTFTLAGGSGMGIAITVAKLGHTPYSRYYHLHPAKERFRPTKDTPEELIVWRNVGNGKRRNAEIEITVPWPLCRHFRLDFLQRKVVGPEEPGDFEVQMQLDADPYVSGKFSAPEDIGPIFTVIDGTYGFCFAPTNERYQPKVGPIGWHWQPSERHPLLSEASYGGLRGVYAPFVILTFRPRSKVLKFEPNMHFREHTSVQGDMSGNHIAFISRGGKVSGRISIADAKFSQGQPGRPEGYMLRIYGVIAQDSLGWNEREPNPTHLLPDPNP